MIDWLFYLSLLVLCIGFALWLIDTLHAWQDELDRQFEERD